MPVMALSALWVAALRPFKVLALASLASLVASRVFRAKECASLVTFAAVAHSSEQYFYIPLFVVKTLPQ